MKNDLQKKKYATLLVLAWCKQHNLDSGLVRLISNGNRLQANATLKQVMIATM
jgi:hypothetical protein